MITNPEPLNPSLQLAIARELPDKIYFGAPYLGEAQYGTPTFVWIDKDVPVLDTEWDYIMLRLIEPKLEHVDMIEYTTKLHIKRTGSTVWDDFYVTNATFNQRAKAYCEVKGIKA